MKVCAVCIFREYAQSGIYFHRQWGIWLPRVQQRLPTDLKTVCMQLWVHPERQTRKKRTSERKKLIRFTEFLKLPKYKGADRQI